MITIKSASMIVPSKPTPSGILWLSESDQMMQCSHEPLISIYKPNNNNINGSILPFSSETMKSSLCCALVHYYPLAGRLRSTEGGRIELDCNAMGAKLVEACSEAEVDDLGDFTPTGAVQDLVPKIDYTTPIEEWPLLLVQVTRFRCGGFCVGTAICHTVVDGWSAASFINSWAKLARGDDLRHDEMPFHDRTMLRSRDRPLMPPRFDHIEFSKPPLLIGSLDTKAEQKKKTSVTLLKVTREQVEGLQKNANEISDQTNMILKRPYTQYEAIASHIWRCASKARALDSRQPTRVRIAVDVRNRLEPSLPQGYFGNAVFITVTSTCLYGELLSKPLSYAAGVIREATERMTDEYIRSALDLMTSQENVGSFRINFHVQGNTESSFPGNPNLVIASWIKLPFCGADFGWGKPLYVGPGMLTVEGKSLIMSSPANDGSLIVALCLQTQYMDSFKKFFYEDMI